MAYCGCGTCAARFRWVAAFFCFAGALVLLALMGAETQKCGVCKSLPGDATGQVTRFDCTSFPALSQEHGDYIEDGIRALLVIPSYHLVGFSTLYGFFGVCTGGL